MSLVNAATQQAISRQRFDWLRAKALRRSGLRDIESGLRRGRIRWDDPDLVAALAGLAADPTLNDRERMRVARCAAARDEARAAEQAEQLKQLKQQEKAS